MERIVVAQQDEIAMMELAQGERRALPSPRVPEREQRLLPLRREPGLDRRLSLCRQRAPPCERLTRGGFGWPELEARLDFRRQVEAREARRAPLHDLKDRELASIRIRAVRAQELGVDPCKRRRRTAHTLVNARHELPERL